MKLHELLAKRAAALKAWKEIVSKAETETRDLNADEEKRESDLKAEIADLDKKIDRARAMADAERSSPAIIERHGDGDFAQRARKEFRITRAIAATFDGTVDAGLERELGQETARRTGRKFQGIAVPDEALLPIEEKRTITTTGAGSLVPTQHRPDLFIEKLRPSLLLPALGATVLDGLIGTQSIPKQIGSSTARWIEEEQPLTESDPAFDDVELSPKTVGALTSFSRRMLLNAVPSVEDLVRRDLAAVIANTVDLAALFGDGLNGQPQGVTLATGVHQVSMSGGATWEKILEMIALVEASDALGGNLGWATSPGAKRKLRATPKLSGEGEGFIMESPTELAGYRVATSSALPGDSADSPTGPAVLVFGNWSSVLLGSWSGVDILANPFEGEAYKRGRVLVRAMRDVDVAVRHGESFSLCDDLSADLASG